MSRSKKYRGLEGQRAASSEHRVRDGFRPGEGYIRIYVLPIALKFRLSKDNPRTPSVHVRGNSQFWLLFVLSLLTIQKGIYCHISAVVHKYLIRDFIP